MFSRSILSSAFKFSLPILLFGMLILSALSRAQASELVLDENQPSWSNFKLFMNQEGKQSHIDGLSYLISGSIATAGGIYGYETSKDPMAKAVFGMSQSLGIVAIGYGAFRWATGNEHTNVYQALNQSKMTPAQKTEFLESYFSQIKKQRKRERVIRAITHGLVAALNLYHSATETNKDLKSAFAFIGGVNVLAAVSYTF